MPAILQDSSKLQEFEQEINQLAQSVRSQVGEQEANYIKKIVRLQRASGIFGRICIALGFIHPLWWLAGVLALALSKILDNMEIGHNVMHGQYDFMNDPQFSGRHYEWDNVADADSWRRYHNFEHHTYTNIIGKDRDYGYGMFRLSNDLPWRPKNRFQIISYALLSLLFEWGVAYHELAGERVFIGKKKENSNLPITHAELKRAFFSKIKKQVFKDYIFWPLVFFPVWGYVLAGNLVANLIRNLWTSTIIFCGHFTEGAHTFKPEDCENESRGQWYVRQILGSSNLEGPRWFHILSGHLSCQIEHHLFPDIPACHYPAMAKKVEKICEKYGVPYNSAGFWAQYKTVLVRVWTHSFPDKDIPVANAA